MRPDPRHSTWGPSSNGQDAGLWLRRFWVRFPMVPPFQGLVVQPAGRRSEIPEVVVRVDPGPFLQIGRCAEWQGSRLLTGRGRPHWRFESAPPSHMLKKERISSHITIRGIKLLTHEMSTINMGPPRQPAASRQTSEPTFHDPPRHPSGQSHVRDALRLRRCPADGHGMRIQRRQRVAAPHRSLLRSSCAGISRNVADQHPLTLLWNPGLHRPGFFFFTTPYP